MLVTLFLNVLLQLICLHIVKWFQVFLSNTDNSVQYKSFAHTWLNGFKYFYLILIILFIRYSYERWMIFTLLCEFNSWGTFFYEPQHTDVPVLADPQEVTNTDIGHSLKDLPGAMNIRER